MLPTYTHICYNNVTSTRLVASASIIMSAIAGKKSGYSVATANNRLEIDYLLDKLGLTRAVLVGKVLVHIDDEHGGSRPGPKDDENFCRLYSGFSRVFRPYWSQNWDRLAGGPGGRLINCTVPCGLAPPAVEWTPLGWSKNWMTTAETSPPPPSSARGTEIAFYGNGKSRTNRISLITHFEQATRIAPVTHTIRKGQSRFGKGNRTDYWWKMRNTRFCLQLPGLSAECYRMYEALDAGCVPVLPFDLGPRYGHDVQTQYRWLVGGRGSAGGEWGVAPFPHGPTSAGLADTMAMLRTDPERASRLQADATRWWQNAMAQVSGRLREAGERVTTTRC